MVIKIYSSAWRTFLTTPDKRPAIKGKPARRPFTSDLCLLFRHLIWRWRGWYALERARTARETVSRNANTWWVGEFSRKMLTPDLKKGVNVSIATDTRDRRTIIHNWPRACSVLTSQVVCYLTSTCGALVGSRCASFLVASKCFQDKKKKKVSKQLCNRQQMWANSYTSSHILHWTVRLAWISTGPHLLTLSRRPKHYLCASKRPHASFSFFFSSLHFFPDGNLPHRSYSFAC